MGKELNEVRELDGLLDGEFHAEGVDRANKYLACPRMINSLLTAEYMKVEC